MLNSRPQYEQAKRVVSELGIRIKDMSTEEKLEPANAALIDRWWAGCKELVAYEWGFDELR